MTQGNTEIEQPKEIETEKAWFELWAFAQSCIHWGECDIDKEKFIYNGKHLFSIVEKQITET